MCDRSGGCGDKGCGVWYDCCRESCEKTIKLFDLRTQRCRIQSQLAERIGMVLDHGKYVNGPEVEELEERIADYCGVKHCVTCNSGTDALVLALTVTGCGIDYTVAPAFTFPATIAAIIQSGGKPLLRDISPDSYLLLEEAQDRMCHPFRTTVFVELFGRNGPYSGCRSHVIDGAQSFRRELSLTDNVAFCTSFFPTKVLGCYGDGGAVLTNDDLIAHGVRVHRDHGRDNGRFVVSGRNSRLDTIQAAVLLCKLDILDDELAARKEVATKYRNLLPVWMVRKTPKSTVESLFPILCRDRTQRDTVQRALNAHGIESKVYYPTPIHLMPAYKYLGYKEGDFPVAEYVSERILCIPCHAYMSEVEVDRVIEVVINA